jgi:hypothetical protein
MEEERLERAGCGMVSRRCREAGAWVSRKTARILAREDDFILSKAGTVNQTKLGIQQDT